MENYYQDHKKKIMDFMIGFGASIIVGLMLLFPINYTDDVIFINLGLLILVQLIAVVLSFVKHRKYISIGIMATWIIPFILLLLLIGTCGNIFG